MVVLTQAQLRTLQAVAFGDASNLRQATLDSLVSSGLVAIHAMVPVLTDKGDRVIDHAIAVRIR